MVKAAKDDTEHHLHDTKDDGHFHLERVDEGNLVIRQHPSRINAERVGTAGVTVIQNRIHLESIPVLGMMMLEATEM